MKCINIVSKQKEFEEIITSKKDGTFIGKIIQADNGEYLFEPHTTMFDSRLPGRLGKGKCLKEIAERLIQLNYKQERRVQNVRKKRK